MKNYNDILKETTENIKIKNSKEQRISSFRKLNSFLEHIQQDNFLVRVIVEDDDDAFQIFETLNERGQHYQNPI